MVVNFAAKLAAERNEHQRWNDLRRAKRRIANEQQQREDDGRERAITLRAVTPAPAP